MVRIRLFGLVLLVAVVAGSCGRGGPPGRPGGGDRSAPERSVRPVEAISVEPASLIRRIEASGSVRGRSEANLLSDAQGVILNSSLQLGSFVTEGDMLVEVEATIPRLNVQEARQVFESARLDLDATQRRFENGSASQAELTRARSAANGARARLEVAETALRDQTIRAPISGFIASRGENLSRGNTVSRGAFIARIVDLDELEVEVGLGEPLLPYLQLGALAEVSIPACGSEPFEAEIIAIAAGASTRTGSFPVVLRWENTCAVVRSGMNARVRIEPIDARPQLIIPAVSLRRDGEGPFVFVVNQEQEQGRVERRSVVLGDRLGERVQVVQGLQEGDLVLTTGVTVVQEGDEVEVTVIGSSGDVL